MPRASAAGGGGAVGGAAGEEWRALSSSATRTINALEARAQELRKVCARAVAPKDAARSKQALRDSREADGDLVAGARETLRRLEAHVQAAPGNAAVGAALGKAAVMALESFEAAQMALVRRISEVEQSAANRGHGRRGARRAQHPAPGGDDNDDGDEGTTLVAGGGGHHHQQQQQQQEAFSIDVYDDIMRERSREVAEIAENIRDIHEIFQHINQLVAEQGEGIQEIADNVDTAADEVTQGRIELEEARRQSDANRNVRCYVFLMLFVLGVLFLVAVLYR